MIDMDVLDSEEEDYYASIDHGGAASDEEDGSVLVRSCVTEEAEYMQKYLKYSSLLFYMLKPSHLLTQGFDKIGWHRRSYSNACVILGDGQIGGRG